MWDTCGQERYDSIWEKYYKQADGVLLVFDISNKESFNKIKNVYVQKIKDNCKIGTQIILLGNKTDLNEERQVSQEEAINLAVNEEYIYKETSCALNENVADAFETIIEMWNVENKKKNQTTPIKKSKTKESMETDDPIFRSNSFVLSERNYTSKKYKSLNDDEENEKINVNKKMNRKKKGFC